MGRLNQSRRQSVGYVYGKQKQNDVTLQPRIRSLSYVQMRSFDQNMKGSGIKERVDKFMNVASSDAVKQASKIVFDNAAPPRAQERMRQVYKRTEPIRNVLNRREELIKLIKEKRGEGLSLAGGMKHGMGMQHSRGSIPTSAGMGLKLSGQGLSLAGSGYNPPPLPAQELKKKLLRKMIREKKMKALGDRKKTSPIKQGFVGRGLSLAGGNLNIAGTLAGGNLNIAGTSSGRSRNKTYEDMRSYKVNPRPLVGQGAGKINPQKIIAYLKKRVGPMLKKEGVLSKAINNEKLQKLVGMKAQKILKTEKDPVQVIKKVLAELKPMMNKNMSGSGIGDLINKLGWKLFAGLLKMSGSKHLAKGADYMANYKGSGCCGSGKKRIIKKKKKMSGGFIISVPAIIAAISAAVGTAMSTTIIGSITVGGVVTAALSAAASAAADKILKEMMKDKKGGALKLAGQGKLERMRKRIKERIKKKMKNALMKVLKKVRISKDDFTAEEKQKLINRYKKFQGDKKLGRIKRFAVDMSPTIKEVARRKVENKARQFIKSYTQKLGLKGFGLKLAGQGGTGLKLAGQGKYSFSRSFVKNFIKEMKKLEKKR
jgi:hypothetical protein